MSRILEQAEHGSRVWILKRVVEERWTRIWMLKRAVKERMTCVLEQKCGSRVVSVKREYESRILYLQDRSCP